MAKKSSKSKKSSVSLDLIFKAGIVLFAVAALAMLFLSGVVFTGKLTGEGGELIFDETALYFELLAEEQLSPNCAPWILVKTLRKG